MYFPIRSISIYCGLLILTIYWGAVQSLWSELQLTKFTNSNEGVLVADLKVKRCKWFALPKQYDVGMTTYYSKIGNNQYVKMPFSYGTSFCSFVNGKRFKRFYKLLRECSDFPNETEGQPLCNLFSIGNYTITNFPMDPVNQVFETGLYKFAVMIAKKDSLDDISRFVIHFKLT